MGFVFSSGVYFKKKKHPKPRMTIPFTEQELLGNRFIRPIAYLGYDDGYNSIIEDIYIPGEKAWLFSKRVRSFSQPCPAEDRCDKCTKYPPYKEPEIIEKRQWPTLDEI